MPAAIATHEAEARARATFAIPIEPYPGATTGRWLLLCSLCSTALAPVTFTKTVKKMVAGRPAHEVCARRCAASLRQVP